MKKIILSYLTLVLSSLMALAQDDPYLWLEEVNGEKALEFAKKQSEATFSTLSKETDYQQIFDESLKIYNAPEKIVYPTIYGDYVYNFWKDETHIRGIWRRTKKVDYINNDPKWETLLDLDALSEQDDMKWVFKGANGLYPDYNRFLVQLSNGGGDAVFIKEFNVNTKQFLTDGFFLDESKGDANFVDENHLIVTTDLGEGSMTSSGYPASVILWERGTDLKDAQILYTCQNSDVGSFGGVVRDGDQAYTYVVRAMTRFSLEKFIWDGNALIKLDIPDDVIPRNILNNQFIFQLKSDWVVETSTYKAGTLLSLNFTKLLMGNREISVMLAPDEFSSITDVSITKNTLLVNTLTNVTSKLYVYSFNKGNWSGRQVPAPDFGTIYIAAASETDDSYFFDFENFITPTTLYAADAAKNTIRPLQSLPAYFDPTKYRVEQYKTASKDGTMVPYFMVSAKGMKKNSSNLTLVYAYGGFEISQTPFYAATYGVSWLEKGGVFVLANIRGGGEFGPKWHQAGIKEKRQNVFDDLYAVSEDLIAKNITAPRHLGVMGGSNGGLLVGVAFTQRPDLYNAVVCRVPLLDMKRYNKLLAGASWMGEYGNPDVPEEWEYIKQYSPYHNLQEGVAYPEVYFYTSTKDDRVHPGHARKMVAKMKDMGYKSYYYENTEGGHAGSSTNEQRARSTALTFSYLLKKLR